MQKCYCSFFFESHVNCMCLRHFAQIWTIEKSCLHPATDPKTSAHGGSEADNDITPHQFTSQNLLLFFPFAVLFM